MAVLIVLLLGEMRPAHAEIPEGLTDSPATESAVIVLPPDEEVLVSALSLMGTPYVRGGTTPQNGGFDCSGFVRFVYQQAGMELTPRSSRDLFASAGDAVSRSSLKPGDLVFFQMGRHAPVNHVGIYLGNDRFIHAPARGGAVRMDNLSQPFWQLYYSGARRVLATG